jgi:hypothetical protein
MPKSGSNLVSKLLDISGVPYGNLGIAPTLLLGKNYLLRQFARRSFFEPNPCIIGLDVQVPVRKAWLRTQLRRVKHDAYITGHLNWSPWMQGALHENDFKTILVVRDPVDTLVSYCHYIRSTRDHFLHSKFRDKELNQIIPIALNSSSFGGIDFLGFPNMLNEILVWTSKPYVHVVKFEDIVGEQGGGSRKVQIEALQYLGEYIGVNFDHSLVERVLFGGSKTFRSGKIGSAVRELEPTVVALAKDALADYSVRLGYE